MVCYHGHKTTPPPYLCNSLSDILLSIFDSLIARISKVYCVRSTLISSICFNKLLIFKLAIFIPFDLVMSRNKQIPGSRSHLVSVVFERSLLVTSSAIGSLWHENPLWNFYVVFLDSCCSPLRNLIKLVAKNAEPLGFRCSLPPFKHVLLNAGIVNKRDVKRYDF